MGASTSPVFLKDIAACTTAVGRGMILKAKSFMERYHGARVVYGDTDSIFCVFDLRDEAGEKLQGDAAIRAAMDASDRATAEFNKTLTAPQNLEAEKCFYPFCLLSKKRYIGIKYPQAHPSQPLVGKRSEMGIALKRRDNAPIVKHVFGGIVDIILKERDIDKSVAFLREHMQKLAGGEASLDSLIVTKSLRATYADPERIAQKVLAERIGARDPGSKPQSNDRIKYVYIHNPAAKLQGDRIETPEFIRDCRLKVDYAHYISNQIQNPVCQFYAVVLEQLPGYNASKHDWAAVRAKVAALCCLWCGISKSIQLGH
jgi:DNA polymerase elongation subunit (family B)